MIDSWRVSGWKDKSAGVCRVDLQAKMYMYVWVYSVAIPATPYVCMHGFGFRVWAAAIQSVNQGSRAKHQAVVTIVVTLMIQTEIPAYSEVYIAITRQRHFGYLKAISAVVDFPWLFTKTPYFAIYDHNTRTLTIHRHWPPTFVLVAPRTLISRTMWAWDIDYLLHFRHNNKIPISKWLILTTYTKVLLTCFYVVISIQLQVIISINNSHITELCGFPCRWL